MKKKVFVHLESGRGYSRDLLKGIYAYNNQHHNWEIIFEPAYYLKTASVKNNLSVIKAIKPDGCILEYAENLKDVMKMGVPVIQATSVNIHQKVPYIKGDYDSDAQMAASYFLRNGFKSIGFFGIEGLEWSKARGQSLQHYATINNAAFFSYLLKGNESDVLAHNFEALKKWLTSLPKPIGILCCNDDFGQILINTCSMAQIRVPAEVAVLGIDNDELICNISSPNLSSIARNHLQIATSMCELLDMMMTTTYKAQEVVLYTQPVEVIVRGSTDVIASADTEVQKAILFIKSRLHVATTVTDVVRATNVSRKVLYARFKSVTGNTINEEIRLRKVQRFKELLKEHRLSVNEAAGQLGFSDCTHISRWFTSMEGISPSEWKKNHQQ